jgi:isopenicillin N synthase-like dioxygenase
VFREASDQALRPPVLGRPARSQKAANNYDQPSIHHSKILSLKPRKLKFFIGQIPVSGFTGKYASENAKDCGMNPKQTIKTLDIRQYRSGNAADKKEFIRALGDSAMDTGFLVVKGHEVSAELQQNAYNKIDAFYKLPVSEKIKYEIKDSLGVRGYTGYGKEHAKNTNIGDLKEFFHVGIEVPAGHPLEKVYTKNVSVPVIPGFDQTLRKLYNTLLGLATDLLRGFAVNLEQEETFFDDNVRYGDSVLRPIHYPPLTGDEHPDAVRSAAHEDINLITLLIGASYPGLQVMGRDGQWIAITTEATEIVVNVGDMLQRLSNYKYKSTTHRVANPPRELIAKDSSRRYSIPFFVHPIPSMSLKALSSCISPLSPQRDPETTAGEFLIQRLKEIGLG